MKNIFMFVIIWNKKVEIIIKNLKEERIISSIIYFKSKNECLIEISIRNNMIENYESTIFESKKLFCYNLIINMFKKF